MYEEALNKQFLYLRRRSVLKQWCKGFFACFSICSSKNRKAKDKHMDREDDFEAVNEMRDRMKSSRRNKKADLKNKREKRGF